MGVLFGRNIATVFSAAASLAILVSGGGGTLLIIVMTQAFGLSRTGLRQFRHYCYTLMTYFGAIAYSVAGFLALASPSLRNFRSVSMVPLA